MTRGLGRCRRPRVGGDVGTPGREHYSLPVDFGLLDGAPEEVGAEGGGAEVGVQGFEGVVYGVGEAGGDRDGAGFAGAFEAAWGEGGGGDQVVKGPVRDLHDGWH